MKKWQIFFTWFLYACATTSLFDLTYYLMEQGLTKRGYILIVGLMFIFLGWLGARLEIKFAKFRKHN